MEVVWRRAINYNDRAVLPNEEVKMLGQGVSSAMRHVGRCWEYMRRVLFFLAVWMLVPSAVFSQNSPPDVDATPSTYLTPRSPAPVLANHRFVSSTLVRSPFIRTNFRNTMGIGSSMGLSLPPIVIGGEEYRFTTGKLLFSTLQFEYQKAVKDWLAVWFDFRLAGRLGTETMSLLSQGVTVTSGFQIGWQLKAWETDDMLLSGAFYLTNASYTAVDLIGYVEGIIEDGLDTSAELVIKVPVMVGNMGLSYAWAATPLIGLTANTNLGYGESADRRAGNEWYFDVGALVDFDLRHDLNAPVGVSIGGQVTNVPDHDQKLIGNAKSVTLGVDYIGRPDFDLGIGFSSQWHDVRDMGDTLFYTLVAIDFRYYF